MVQGARIIFVLLVLMLFFLAGCKTAGKAIQLPPDPNQPGFGIERSIDGNTITLTVYRQALASNEIIIVAEKLPSGVTYSAASASITPTFYDDTLLTWIFAESAPQQLGQLNINDQIPAKITYLTNPAPAANAQFRGKWGLKELNIEGLISASGVQTMGTVTILDVLNAITDYKNGAITILELLNVIERYKQG